MVVRTIGIGHGDVVVPREALRRLMRGCEMSAELMRDPERTGGWSGSENVARAFERYSRDLRALLDTCSPETAPTHFTVKP